MSGAARLLYAAGGHALRRVASAFACACGRVLALARACERRARP